MSAGANLKTPLHALHLELGARMGPFAGYDMPIQYPRGVLGEHLHTRSAAGLFDVSHMGQALIEAPDHTAAAGFLETLCPADLKGLEPGRQRYTQLLNADGGVVDDLMVARPRTAGGSLKLVVNASRKAIDFDLIAKQAPADIRLVPLDDHALIALQGPLAASVLFRVAPDAHLETMHFMDARSANIGGHATFLSRSGYSGEDGYEIALPMSEAEALARRLLSEPEVAPVGLGARDSLRLEAGLCLYGHELDESVDPVEAAIEWSIQKRRRLEGGFPGAARIQRALADGPARRRVGLRPDGRAPARDGVEIVSKDGAPIGIVTSGGFGPSVGGPIAMGFVSRADAVSGAPVGLMVRGRQMDARIVPLPFHPHRYFRG